MRLFLLAILISFNSKHSVSQSSEYSDSMLRLIKVTKNDSARIYKMNELSFFYIFNDIGKAKDLIQKGIQEAKRKNQYHGLSQLYLSKGIYHDVQNQKDSAEHYFTEGLAISKTKKFRDVEMLALNNLGMFNWSKGEFNEALNYFLSALEINKKHFPERAESRANYYSNIGLIYQELRQFDNAIKYHNSSLDTRNKLALKNDQAISYANLGLCYLETKNYPRAEKNFKLAIQRAKEAENWRMYYSVHDNLGSLYRTIKDYNKAIEHFETALNRPKELGINPKSDISICANLAILYNQLNDSKNAFEHISKGFELLKNNPELKKFAAELYLARAEYHYLNGLLSNARRDIEYFKEITDSIFSSSQASALANWEKKYDALENKLTISNQQRIIQKNELKVQRSRIWLIVSSSSLILFILILFILLKRKALKAEKAELLLSVTKQEQILENQEERLRISRELHDNIGSYLTLMSATAEDLSNSSKNEDKVKNLKDNLSMSMRELRRTVWLINQNAATIDEIALKLRDFYKPLNQKEIEIRVDVDLEVEDFVLNDVQTTHVFRVIQEAISNAIKYSNGTSILVSFQSRDKNELNFSIRDNGKGFSDSDNKFGNGIKNMRSRIEELNGKFQIESTTAGTSIFCTLPNVNTQKCV